MSVYQYQTTKAQEATVMRLKLENHLTFMYGQLGAIQFDDDSINCYTIFTDGEYAHEVRDFTSEGWKPADE